MFSSFLHFNPSLICIRTLFSILRKQGSLSPRLLFLWLTVILTDHWVSPQKEPDRDNKVSKWK